MKTLIFSLLLGIFSSPIFAQYGDVTSSSEGLSVTAEQAIDALVEKHRALNISKGTVKGFRIQIAQSPNRQQVYQAKSQLLQVMPNEDIDVVYQQPDYKLRIGHFMERRDATRVLTEIKKTFSAAFIIPAEIKVHKILGQ